MKKLKRKFKRLKKKARKYGMEKSRLKMFQKGFKSYLRHKNKRFAKHLLKKMKSRTNEVKNSYYQKKLK